MARKSKKVQKIGYALRINRTGASGESSWESVGFLFDSRDAAHNHKSRHYPTVDKFTVMGVRLNMEAVQAPGRHSDDNSRKA